MPTALPAQVAPMWRGEAGPEEAAPPTSAPSGKPDPTATLPWATPPETVGCTIRGAGSPDPGATCGGPTAEVLEAGRIVAVINLADERLETLWGVPKREATSGALWVHARGSGMSVTGHTVSPVIFALARDAMVVEDHVWGKAGALVRPRRADVGVSVAIQDPFVGVSKIAAVVACDDLAFRPVEAAAPTTATAAPPAAGAAPPEPVLRYMRSSSLSLYTSPGGTLITTLLHDPEGAMQPDLEVKESRGAHLRVTFETEFARFDAWVLRNQTADEPTLDQIGRSGDCGSGLGLRGGDIRALPLAGAASVHVGKPGGALRKTSGIILAAGTIVRITDTEGELWQIASPNSSVEPPEGEEFFVHQKAFGLE